MKAEMKERIKKLKSDVCAVFVALGENDTPAIAKVFAAICIAYALSPVDLIPDFIPLLGCLDDLLILPALVALTVRCIPHDIWERSRAKAAGMWENGLPKKWYFAIPIVAVWLLIIWLIIKAIFFR